MQLKCDRKWWPILKSELFDFVLFFTTKLYWWPTFLLPNGFRGHLLTTREESPLKPVWEPQTQMVKSSFPFFHLSVWGCSICSFRHNFHRSVNNATLQPPSLRWWLFSGKMEWKTRKENTFLISGLGGGLRQFLFWLLGYFFLGTWGYSRLHNHTCKHCLTIFLTVKG